MARANIILALVHGHAAMESFQVSSCRTRCEILAPTVNNRKIQASHQNASDVLFAVLACSYCTKNKEHQHWSNILGAGRTDGEHYDNIHTRIKRNAFDGGTIY
jgi:hypothetical protein